MLTEPHEHVNNSCFTVRSAVAKGLNEAGYRRVRSDDGRIIWQDERGMTVTIPRCDPLSLFLAGKVLAVAGLTPEETGRILRLVVRPSKPPPITPVRGAKGTH